jgi:Zn/Cd-binding protein ZinT
MKTALTEWFDELKSNYPYMANEIFDKGFSKYLEKEKEHIKTAYNVGVHNALDKIEITSEEYYQEKYNKI